MTVAVGGCFAPSLTEEKLNSYKALAESASPEIRDAMLTLHKCALHWWNQPPSGNVGERHPVGNILAPDGLTIHPSPTIMMLEDSVAKSLWSYIPWKRELDSYQELFASIPETQKQLRDAAHHLLWIACELDNNREPLSLDWEDGHPKFMKELSL